MNVSSVKNLNGEVLSAVQDASLTNVIQTNSGNWQDITAYQNASATYLTEVSIPESATWNEVSTTVQTNSAKIDDTVISYQTNSGTFLTAQEVSHDNTLSGNGTVESPLGVNLSDVAQLFGVDETVLFQTSSVDDTKWDVTLSEDIGNFERIKILARRNNNSIIINLDCPNVYEDDTSAISGNKKMMTCDCDMDGAEYKYFTVFSLSGNKYTEYSARLMKYGMEPDVWQTNNIWLHPTKIIGIDRKQ